MANELEISCRCPLDGSFIVNKAKADAVAAPGIDLNVVNTDDPRHAHTGFLDFTGPCQQQGHVWTIEVSDRDVVFYRVG
jgi:hypothetical protein